MEKLTILITDDEQSQAEALKSFLSRRGFNVFTALSGKEALETVNNNLVDIVLTDYRMPGMDGFTLLKELKKANPAIDVIVMTAYGSIEDAVSIMKAGAYDYLTKPVDLDELELALERLAEKRMLVSENRRMKQELGKRYGFEAIVSGSARMEEALNAAARVAESRATVLVRGESGTGKELVARGIHYASARKDKPFVIVNAASLPDNLLESELFGHEKGAFTGAVAARKGRFEEAGGGTLFIDEVGDIPSHIQVKLLRAVQFGEVQRIGSNETITTDVRIIAATHRNLEEMIKEGEFREDLYYRLNVVGITIPPLRERKEDIPALVNRFIEKHAERNGKNVDGISNEAMDRLMKYNFPGNVRELENIIERGVVLTRGSVITVNDIPAEKSTSAQNVLFDPADLSAGYEKKLKEFEKSMLEQALTETGGNKSAAARLLGITERHLRSRLERV